MDMNSENFMMLERSFRTILTLFCIVMMLMAGLVWADEVEQRRIHISASLFPRIVVVDLDVKKKLDAQGNARILIVYRSSRYVAQDVAALISEKVKKVEDLTVVSEVMSVDEMNVSEHSTYTAIFLAEKFSPEGFEKLKARAREDGRLLFSPFSGDVEKGSMVGISVDNRIRPYFNITALQQAGIRMNSKLLKVSKQHE